MCIRDSDDLLATGGTIKCVDNLVKKSGKKISGCITVVELIDLKGRNVLDFSVESILKIWRNSWTLQNCLFFRKLLDNFKKFY